MFNALALSYSRLPVALAEDGWLPSLLARRDAATGAPRVAIVACAVAWAACLGLGFERLVELDVLLYGLSLLLEFAALVALRVREPSLPRPFRAPGGIVGAALLGVGPLALLGLALARGAVEPGGASGLRTGALLVALGPAIWLLRRRAAARRGSENAARERAAAAPTET
jgi:amino acid transporter